MTVYRVSDHWSNNTDLRERFHLEASFLWARGLPAPTADEIADAMVKVLEPVEVVEHVCWYCRNASIEAAKHATPTESRPNVH